MKVQLYKISTCNTVYSKPNTFFCSCVNGPWEFGVGCGGLGCYDYVGPILGCLESNGLTNASACSSNENGLSCQQSAKTVCTIIIDSF